MSFIRGDEMFVRMMKEKFHEFYEAADLKANHTKWGSAMDSELMKGSFSFKYLEVPWTSRKLSIHHCKP